MASSPSAEARAPRTARLWVAVAWLLCCAMLLWLMRANIAALAFRDPDDAMRLQQVRDWIGGQAFRDVSQHRVNPPAGGPMHWSRIVDMPIAALILLLRPLLGAAGAEIAALAAVPLLLLGGLTAALCRVGHLIAGRGVAIAACLLLLTAPSILIQFTPMRIDHHGWQILLAGIALAGMFAPRPWRGGLVTGVAIALWLQISSEGLPFAALFAGVIALRQLFDRAETPRFVAMAAALGGGALVALALLRGVGPLVDRQCDALSLPFVWPLAGMGAATLAAAWLLGTHSIGRRLGIAAAGGGAALILFLTLGGPCLSGDPFAALGPTAYRLWYRGVMEGRPVWEQGIAQGGVILLTPLIGLIATLAAARRAQGTARMDWLMLALLLLGATLVAGLVARAMSVAHLFALPGIGWALVTLLRGVGRAQLAVLRVMGTVALMAITPLGLVLLWLGIAPGEEASSGTAGDACLTPAAIAPLARLPQGVALTPLDMGPDLLIRTRHGVIGTAHHRNAAGITAVIEAYISRPEQARAVLARLDGGRGVDYVLSCAALGEMKRYVRENPRGLAAMLVAGKTPGWLERVPLPGPVVAYRVLPSGRKASATPFMQ